jgi:hypothetical protein
MLEHGYRSFWRVYPTKRKITVAYSDSSGVHATDFHLHELIVVDLFGIKGTVVVRKNFEGVD